MAAKGGNFMFRKAFVFSGILTLLLSASVFAAPESTTSFILKNFHDPSVRASIAASAGVQLEKTKEGIKVKEEGYLGSSQPKDTLKPAEIQALQALKKREMGLMVPPEFVFSDNISNGYAIKFGGKTIRMRHAQAKADATIERSAVVYKNAYRSTDVLYLLGPGRCQEILVLHSKDAPTKFVYECNIESSGKADVNNNGELTAGGMTLSKPLIFDASGKKVEGRYEKTSGGIVLALNPQGLKYPLLIDPVWKPLPNPSSMADSRGYPTATLLPNGKVLVTGGVVQTLPIWGAGSSADLFDPVTGSFVSPRPSSMIYARYGHTATLLTKGNNRGKVLIAGGVNNSGAVATAEVYDPAVINGFTEITGTSMINPRYFHTATRLTDGKVLLAGGASQGGTNGYMVTGTPSAAADFKAVTDGSFNIAIEGVLYSVTGLDFSGISDDPDQGHYDIASYIQATLEAMGAPVFVTWEADNHFQFFDYNTGPTSVVSKCWGAYGGSGPGGIFGTDISGVQYGPNEGLYLNADLNATQVLGNWSNYVPFDSAELFDPEGNGGDGSFASTSNNMSTVRYGHTATLLIDGTVLMAGGSDETSAVASAEIYDPSSGFGAPIIMQAARFNHTGTLMCDGTVLLAGGYNDTDGYLTSGERYYPSSNTFSPTPYGLNYARSEHSATLLPDGTVLLTGGTAGSALQQIVEKFDPTFAGGYFFDVGYSNYAVADHSAVLLPDGSVFLVGGFIGADKGGAYDTGQWYVTNPPDYFDQITAGQLTDARYNHTATLLPTGNVLIAGGCNETSGTLASSEVYVPDTDTFAPVSPYPDMKYPRQMHMATLLANGNVLVAGGYDDSGRHVATAEIYDYNARGYLPDTVPMMVHPRHGHTATLLPDGTVLIAGGSGESGALDSAEIFYPSTGKFYEIVGLAGRLTSARMDHSATLLTKGSNMGKVLIAGGRSGSDFLNSSMLYDPSAHSFSASGYMTDPRANHTATLLQDGRVLIAGGNKALDVSSASSYSGTELYDPNTGAFSASSYATSIYRTNHTATLLPNGKVLLVRGDSYNYGLAQSHTYDQGTDSFLSGPALGGDYHNFTATLLPSGKVLVVGGKILSIASQTGWTAPYTEYYYVGLYSLISSFEAVRPVVLLIDGNDAVYTPNAIAPETSYQIQGTGFFGTSEASGGNNGANSPTNYPRVYLQKMDSGGYAGRAESSMLIDCTSSVYSNSVSDTSIYFTTPGGYELPAGYYLLTVVANSVPSVGRVVYYNYGAVYPSLNPVLDWVKLNGKLVAQGQTNYTAPNPQVEVHISAVNGINTPTASFGIFYTVIQSFGFTLEAGDNFSGTWIGTEPLAASQEGINYPNLYILASDQGGNTWDSGQFGCAYPIRVGAGGGRVQVVGNLYNYPNPFKPSSGGTTQIQYSLTKDASIILIIYDISGHEVQRFKYGAGTSGGAVGVNQVTWNGKSLSGKVIGNGMYLYKIISGDKVLGDGRIVVID